MQDVRLHPPPEPEREPRGRSAGQSAGQPEAGAIDEHAIRSDPALLAAGWTRRNLAEPARIEELIDLYRALGFEARAVQLTPEDFGPSCVSCASAICRTYVMIYTRRAEPPRQSEREG
jgi:hypothetical protein